MVTRGGGQSNAETGLPVIFEELFMVFMIIFFHFHGFMVIFLEIHGFHVYWERFKEILVQIKL